MRRARVEGVVELDVFSPARERERADDERRCDREAPALAHQKLHAMDEPAWIHTGDGAKTTSLPTSQRW